MASGGGGGSSGAGRRARGSGQGRASRAGCCRQQECHPGATRGRAGGGSQGSAYSGCPSAVLLADVPLMIVPGSDLRTYLLTSHFQGQND